MLACFHDQSSHRRAAVPYAAADACNGSADLLHALNEWIIERCLLKTLPRYQRSDNRARWHTLYHRKCTMMIISSRSSFASKLLLPSQKCWLMANAKNPTFATGTNIILSIIDPGFTGDEGYRSLRVVIRITTVYGQTGNIWTSIPTFAQKGRLSLRRISDISGRGDDVELGKFTSADPLSSLRISLKQ